MNSLRKVNKKYRFFYHYNKHTKQMSVHFKGTCIPCKDIVCMVQCESHRRNVQPRIVMRGFCEEVKIEEGKCIIK